MPFTSENAPVKIDPAVYRAAMEALEHTENARRLVVEEEAKIGID
jgi:hypothetical protein